MPSKSQRIGTSSADRDAVGPARPSAAVVPGAFPPVAAAVLIPPAAAARELPDDHHQCREGDRDEDEEEQVSLVHGVYSPAASASEGGSRSATDLTTSSGRNGYFSISF